MRKMNRIAGILLAMVLICGFVGCGGSDSSSTTKPGPGPGPGPSPDPDPEIPSLTDSGPKHFEVVGMDGKLDIRFTKIADASGVTPKYDLRYGISDVFENAVSLGTDVLTRSKDEDTGIPKGPVAGKIDGLINGVTYYVWVNAIWEGLGESSYCMESGMPVPTPKTPTGVVATAYEGMIEVTWNVPEYAFSYEVAWHTGTNVTNGQVVKMNTPEPRYLITTSNLDGLPFANDGKSYNIWVNASNTNGTSDYTPTYVTATPVLAGAAPAAPNSVFVEPGKKRLKVLWDAVKWASGYELYYGTSNNPASATKIDIAPEMGTVRATIGNLINGTQYNVWVKAKNSQGSSDFSALRSGTPKEADIAINFNNLNFQLGVSAAEFQFGEILPDTPLVSSSRAGVYQDNFHRSKETPLGNLFTDSAMWYLNEYLDDFEKVDFVFLNSSFINSSISPRSPITVGSLKTIINNPLGEDRIVILEMKGSDIKALFDFAAKNSPHMGYKGNFDYGGRRRSSGEWVLVSKEVNYTAEYKFVDSAFMSGPRLSTSNTAHTEILASYFFGKIKADTLKFNGADFDDNTTYRIATTDYLEGELYFVPMSKATKVTDTGIPYWHAVAEYIYDAGTITPTALEGRIKVEGGVPGGPLGVTQGYNKYCPEDAEYSETSGCIFP